VIKLGIGHPRKKERKKLEERKKEWVSWALRFLVVGEA